ncbi:MAG: phosphohistidine phosphatase SixA [Chlamydiales bacterium]|jgi:phosphohistidine phosphatase SixA
MKNALIGLIAATCAAMLGIGAAAFSSDPVLARASSPDGAALTVFFVRHAETETSTSTTRDPRLSQDGEQRAASLARLLSRAHVTHLFASEYQRTQATLAPLAEQRTLDVSVVPAGKADDLVGTLRALPAGSVAVVAGHSNTVPQLVAAVGGQAAELVDHPKYGKMLADTEYDRLFVVQAPTFGEGDAATLELRYGRE